MITYPEKPNKGKEYRLSGKEIVVTEFAVSSFVSFVFYDVKDSSESGVLEYNDFRNKADYK